MRRSRHLEWWASVVLAAVCLLLGSNLSRQVQDFRAQKARWKTAGQRLLSRAAPVSRPVIEPQRTQSQNLHKSGSDRLAAPKLETGSWKLATGKARAGAERSSAADNRKSKIENRKSKLETGNWKLESRKVESRKLKVESRESRVQGRKVEESKSRGVESRRSKVEESKSRKVEGSKSGSTSPLDKLTALSNVEGLPVPEQSRGEGRKLKDEAAQSKIQNRKSQMAGQRPALLPALSSAIVNRQSKIENLTPLGYVEKAGGQVEAVVADGDSVRLVHEGDAFDDHARVGKITASAVEIVREVPQAASPSEVLLAEANTGEVESRESRVESRKVEESKSREVEESKGQVATSKLATGNWQPATGNWQLESRLLGYVEKADGQVQTIVADGEHVRLIREDPALVAKARFGPPSGARRAQEGPQAGFGIRDSGLGTRDSRVEKSKSRKAKSRPRNWKLETGNSKMTCLPDSRLPTPYSRLCLLQSSIDNRQSTIPRQCSWVKSPRSLAWTGHGPCHHGT